MGKIIDISSRRELYACKLIIRGNFGVWEMLTVAPVGMPVSSFNQDDLERAARSIIMSKAKNVKERDKLFNDLSMAESIILKEIYRIGG